MINSLLNYKIYCDGHQKIKEENWTTDAQRFKNLLLTDHPRTRNSIGQVITSGFLYKRVLNGQLMNLRITEYSGYNRLRRSDTQVNSKLREKTKTPIKMLPRQVFSYNDKLIQIASVKPHKIY